MHYRVSGEKRTLHREEDNFMAPKGKTMLKVVSILYIIFSGISILFGLLALVGGGMIAAGGDMMGAGVGAVAAIMGVVVILSSVFSLIVGIIGVKNCAKPEKAQVCFVLGIILIVLAALSLISSFGSNGNVFSGLIGLVLRSCTRWAPTGTSSRPSPRRRPRLRRTTRTGTAPSCKNFSDKKNRAWRGSFFDCISRDAVRYWN